MLPVIAAVALAGGAYGLYRLLTDPDFAPGSKAICDTSREIGKFYNAAIRLPWPIQARLRMRRDANRERLIRAMEEAGRPRPVRFIIQGSYAMDTIIQQPHDDYDIDDGVVLSAATLVGPRGGCFSPHDVKTFVCSAVTAPQFMAKPEVRRNCVRVHYNEGHHVDVPVYREVATEGVAGLELASSSWKRADPEGVTRWFDHAVRTKSPDHNNGRQLRRVVRLLKAFARSRQSWNLPSGFVLSVLAVECYLPFPDRDDLALYETMRQVHSRLRENVVVPHPVLAEPLTRSDRDSDIVALSARLGEALRALQVLFVGSHEQACAAWGEVFGSSEFPRGTS